MRSIKHSLFTDAELEAIAKRLKGNYSDPTGIYSNRVYPKLLEIQAWHSRSMKKNLRKLLEQKRKCNTIPEPSLPMEEQSLEQFKQEVGF